MATHRWSRECYTTLPKGSAFSQLSRRSRIRTLPFHSVRRPDASAVGIGAVLYQHDPETNAQRYISFQARSLSAAERNYSATKRELLAVVFAFKRFHHFIYGRRFTLYTDHHALVHLHMEPHLNAMMQSWYEQLFDMTLLCSIARVSRTSCQIVSRVSSHRWSWRGRASSTRALPTNRVSSCVTTALRCS